MNNKYEEAVEDLTEVMHDLTCDGQEICGLSIYQIIDKLIAIRNVLQYSKKEHDMLEKVTSDLDTVRTNYFNLIQDTNAESIRAKKEHELLGLIMYYMDYNLFPSEVVDKINQLKEELK